MAKDQTAKVIRQAICDAVWSGEIDGDFTTEVAEKFRCSTALALHTLMSIVKGTSGDTRFRVHVAYEAAIIANGRVFVHDLAKKDPRDWRDYPRFKHFANEYIWWTDNIQGAGPAPITLDDFVPTPSNDRKG